MTTAKELPKASFVRQGLYTIASKGCLLAMGVAISVIVARKLGPEGKGTLSLFQVLPAILVSMGSLGVRQSSALFIGKKTYQEKHIYSSIVLIYAMVSIILALTAVVIVNSYEAFSKHDNLVLLCFIAIVPLELFKNYNTGVLLAKQKIERFNNLELYMQLIVMISIMVLTVSGKLIIESVAISYLVSHVITASILLVWIKEYCFKIIAPAKEVTLKLVKKGFVFALALFVIQLNHKFDFLLLGALKDESSVGVYSIGVSLAELLQQVPLAVGLVLFSRSTQWQAKELPTKLTEVAFISRLTFVMLLALAVVLSAAAYWLVPAVFGDSFSGSTTVIWLLALGVVFMGIFHNLHIFAAGQGNPQIAIYVFVPALILNIALNLILIPEFDYLGSAVSSTITYTIATFCYIGLFAKKYGVSSKELLFVKHSDFSRLFSKLKSI